jgi:hypothetical protein
MKTLSHHINTVKAQPHHVRKRVAFAAAFVTAAVIALIWLGASLATGAFAIKGSNFAEANGTPSIVATTPSGTSLTAAAAEAGNSGSQPAGIQIVDGNGSQPAAAPASQPTSISF